MSDSHTHIMIIFLSVDHVEQVAFHLLLMVSPIFAFALKNICWT